MAAPAQPRGAEKRADAPEATARQTLQGHTGAVTSVCPSPDGARLYSGSGDYTIKVWDTTRP